MKKKCPKSQLGSKENFDAFKSIKKPMKNCFNDFCPKGH